LDKKNASANSAPPNDKSKVKNGYLFFRYIMAEDIDNARKIYATKENVAMVEDNPKMAKVDIAKDEKAYYRQLASELGLCMGEIQNAVGYPQ